MEAELRILLGAHGGLLKWTFLFSFLVVYSWCSKEAHRA